MSRVKKKVKLGMARHQPYAKNQMKTQTMRRQMITDSTSDKEQAPAGNGTGTKQNHEKSKGDQRERITGEQGTDNGMDFSEEERRVATANEPHNTSKSPMPPKVPQPLRKAH